MKKIIFALCATVALPSIALAQGWDYATSNTGYQQPQYNGGYQQPVQRQYQQGSYQQPAQRQYQQGGYQQPTQRQYQQGGYQQPVQGQYQQRQYNGTYQQPAQRQQMQRYNPDVQGYDTYNQGYAQNRSTSKKTFYVTPRLGGSYIDFSNDDADGLDGAFGLVADVAAGMYFGDFRADLEFAYHFEREIYSEGPYSIDYNQMDFLANGYYDFKTNSPLTPFIGAGIGFINSELSADGPYIGDASDSETNFGIALSGGASYAFSDNMEFEALGRGKYVFCDGDLYNLEILGGVRFSF